MHVFLHKQYLTPFENVYMCVYVYIYIYHLCVSDLCVFQWNYTLCLNYTHIYLHDYSSGQSVSISLYEMLNNSFKIYTYPKGLLTMLNIYFFFYQVFLWSLPHYDSVGYIIQAQNGYYPFLVFWLR